MAVKNNRRRLVVAAIALAGLTGGAVAAHAETFGQRVLHLAVAPGAFPAIPSIPPTCVGSCTIGLAVGTGSVVVQDAVNGPQTVPFWGFGVNGAPVALAGSTNSTIKVPQGSILTINLTQSAVAGDVELSFPSLPAADVSHVGNTYHVVASQVGTSVFQPGAGADSTVGANAPKQIAMGLVGVLIVTPSGCPGVNKSCAFDGGVSYADEALVATTDLDPEFAANPGAFNMGYFGQAPNPDGSPRKVYHLIDGQSFPDTKIIDVRQGDNVLLRYVNAGVSDKSLGLLGLRLRLLGRNASPYDDPQTLISPLVGPGETADIDLTVPLTASVGQFYSLMDQGRQENHGTASGFGGALTFLDVWPQGQPTAPQPPTVTVTSYVLATHQLSGSATASDAQYPVNLVEYSYDNATWSPLVTGGPIYSFSGTVPPPPVPGSIYVRVTDSNGAHATASIPVAAAVPTVTGATAKANGDIAATATPTAGLTVTAAEYFVGAGNPAPGTATALTVSGGPGSYTLSVNDPTVVPGDTVSIRAQDSFGQWSSITAVVVSALPTVSGASALSTGEIAATATADTGLSVTAAEYFVGTTDPGVGLGTALTVSGTGPYSLDATDLTLLAGDVVSIRAQDSLGQWSSIVTAVVGP